MKRYILIAIALLLLLPLIALGWLMYSEAGLQWAYRQAQPRLPGDLQVSGISGRLAGPITLRQVEFEQPELRVSATRLDLRWNPWALLHGEIEIENLEVDTLAVTLPPGAATRDASTDTSLPTLELPLQLQLKRLAVDGFVFTRDDSRIDLQQIRLGAALRSDGLHLDSAEIVARDFGISLDGSLQPAANYPHDFNLNWHLLLPSGTRLDGSGALRGDLRETAIEQNIRGPLQLDLRLVLNDLLQAPGWMLEADLADFDSARLDATLPPLTGAAKFSARGDLESASANGSLQINSGIPLPIDARFSLARVAANAEFTGLTFDALQVQTVDGELDASGRVDWAPRLAWQARIAAQNLNPERAAAGWPGRIDATLTTTGGLDDGRPFAQVEVTRLQGELRGYPVNLQGNLQWQNDTLDLAGLNFASGKTRVSADGRIGDMFDLRWTLASENLAELYPGARGRLSAQGSLQGAQTAPTIRAQFSGSELALSEHRIARIDGVTRFDLLQPRQLELAPQRLEIEFSAQQLELQGQRIESLEISADNQRIRARLDSALANASLELSGSLEGLGWRGQVIDADIRTPAHGEWQLQQPAALHLSAGAVSLQPLCLQNAAQNSVCASVEGADADWRIGADLTRIPLAWLREYIPPDLQIAGLLDANAKLHYRLPGRLLGEARVELAPGKLGYRLREDRVEQIDYRGGELRLVLTADGISASADLVLRDDENLSASLSLPGANALALEPQKQPLQASARVNLNDLDIVDALLEDIADLRGRAEIRLELGGTLGQPRPRGEASLVGVSFGIPRLQLAVTRLSAEAVSEGDTALKYRVDAATAGGELKLDGRSLLDATAGWASDLRINATGLDLAQLLKPWLPPELRLEGKLNSNAELKLRLPDQLHGTARIATTRGTLTYPLPDGEPGQWTFRETDLNIALDASGISGDTGFSIGENNFLARFSLPRASLLTLDFEQQQLQANAELDFRDLNLLETLVPDLHQTRGRLQVNLSLAGTLAQPGLQGQAQLSDASVRIPRLGLELQQISLNASTDESGELGFEARASSGDGSIRVQGTSLLDAKQGWPTTIRIDGKDFQAARIPVASVSLSPELTIRIQDYTVDVQGQVRIPFARLQPRDITSAATVSTDAVIIGGDNPVERKWQVTSKTSLVLGERVSFFGYGFEGKLGGNLLIEEQPGQPTRGSGVINIREGRYRAYGQHLDIENGRLLFAGGPLTNPGLDIRATRQTGDVIAGVQVGGRLQKPELELFSSPAMGQTDTLSYLLTGGPLETATSEEGAMMANAALALGLSGGDRIARSIGDQFGFDDLRVESSSSGEQASLVVGRYLSPRLYVSYGVGLIESINTLNLRYQISSKWRLETESGAEQGADLLYSIER